MLGNLDSCLWWLRLLPKSVIGFLEILGMVAPIFAVMAIGFGIRRMGVLNAAADASFLKLTVNLLLPCLALDVIVGNEALLDPKNLILPPILGFLVVGVGYGVCYGAAHFCRSLGDKGRRTFAFTAGIQNYGYIPLPLVLAIFGRETAGVLFGFCLGVDLCLWTVGIVLLGGFQGWSSLRRAVNVPVVAIASALVLNLNGGGEWMPMWIQRTWEMLGACGVPLALLLTGAVFADLAIPANLFRGKDVIVFGLLLRMLILPLGILAAAVFLPLDMPLREVLAVQAAMPAAAAPLAIARHYHGDSETALKVVLSTTVAALFTIPIWLKAGFLWIGIGG
jgi:predicted permease